MTKRTQAGHQTQRCVRSAPPDTQRKHRRCQVPRLPRKSAAASRASRATNGTQAPHQTQACARRATPATQNESGCRQAPATQKCRGVTGVTGGPSASLDPAMCQKCHASQAKPTAMCQKCHACQKAERRCQKCHACHAKVPRRHGRHGRPQPDPAQSQPCVRSATPAR